MRNLLIVVGPLLAALACQRVELPPPPPIHLPQLAKASPSVADQLLGRPIFIFPHPDSARWGDSVQWRHYEWATPRGLLGSDRVEIRFDYGVPTEILIWQLRGYDDPREALAAVNVRLPREALREGADEAWWSGVYQGIRFRRIWASRVGPFQNRSSRDYAFVGATIDVSPRRAGSSR